jgi:hypothetical protein
MDAWVYQLKDAYEAGYYRTEAAEASQTRFPWQNKTCKDCPFWSNSICRVFGAYRPAEIHTCSYFDPWNRAQGEEVIRMRASKEVVRWWEWLNHRHDSGAAR